MITIRANNPINTLSALHSILNVASIVCMGGYIPTETDQKEAPLKGRYWYREKDSNRIQLFGLANNHWCHILEEADDHITISFHIRYDNMGKQVSTLCQLILEFFPEVTTKTNNHANKSNIRGSNRS